MRIPLTRPYITDKEIKEVAEVLKSGWLYCGPVSQRFEEKFAEYLGVKHAVSVNSGTSALFLSIKSLKRKGEIIVPSFTYVATVNAIINGGCKPVFCDISPDTCNINPDLIEKKLTKKTIAILPVHFAGLSCEMKKIKEIADERNLVLIEDSAQAIGAEYHGKKTGSFGIGCFSFDPLKNMTTGEGGMVATSDDEIVRLIRLSKNQGIEKTPLSRKKESNPSKPWIKNSIIPGFSLRMSEPAAALGLVQLSRLDEMNGRRIENASYLNKNLDFKEIEIPVPVKGFKHTYEMYTIKVNNRVIDRDNFVMFLRDNQIEASVHFEPAVHQMKIVKKKATLKVTEDMSKRIVTLPMFPQLKKEEMDFIIEKIGEGLKQCRLK